MNPKIKVFVITFIFLLSVFLVSSDTLITNFYNSTNDSLGTSTNITFNQAESNFVYLQIPKNSTVINASLNVSGPPLFSTIFDEESWAYTNDTELFDEAKGVDKDWSTYSYIVSSNFGPDTYTHYENVSLLDNTKAEYLTYKCSGTGLQPKTCKVDCFNSTGEWYELFYSGTYYTDLFYNNVTLPIACKLSPLQFKVKQTIDDTSDKEVRFYELAVINSTYLTNLSLDIANNSNFDWSMTGELNSSNSPQNITLNITAIQNYIDTNNADADGYVYVPLNFTSDTAGIVQVDTLELWYNDDLMSVDFVSPTEANDTGISKNWTYINVTSVADVDNPLNIDTCTLNFNGNSTAMTKVGSGTAVSCYQNKTNLPEARYIYNVTVNNTGGGSNTSETRYLYIDSIQPYRLDITAPVETYNSSSQTVTFNWTCYDAVGYLASNLSIDGTVNVSAISTSNGTPTTQAVSGLAESSHNWSVLCYDKNSNTNTSATYNFTVDITYPLMENISVSGITQSTATIEHDNGESTIATIDYGVISGSYTLSTSDSNYNSSHTHSLTGLESGRVYYFRINATDYFGNSNLSQEKSFTTSSQTLSGRGGAGTSPSTAEQIRRLLTLEPTQIELTNQTKDYIYESYVTQTKEFTEYNDAANALITIHRYNQLNAMQTVFSWYIQRFAHIKIKGFFGDNITWFMGLGGLATILYRPIKPTKQRRLFRNGRILRKYISKLPKNIKGTRSNLFLNGRFIRTRKLSASDKIEEDEDLLQTKKKKLKTLKKKLRRHSKL